MEGRGGRHACHHAHFRLNVRAYRGQMGGGSKWQARDATRRISSKLSGPKGRLSRCCFFSSPWGKCPISVTNVCRGDGRQNWRFWNRAGLLFNKIENLKFCVFLLHCRSIYEKINLWILVMFGNVKICYVQGSLKVPLRQRQNVTYASNSKSQFYILIKLLHFC